MTAEDRRRLEALIAEWRQRAAECELNAATHPEAVNAIALNSHARALNKCADELEAGL